MKPYKHRKLEEWPDVADIKCEGRASHVGHSAGKNGECRSYFRNSAKKKRTRRCLKRADKKKEKIDAES